MATRYERVKNLAYKTLQGTKANMARGLRSNLDPNQKGGIANFVAQFRDLYGKKGRQRRKRFLEGLEKYETRKTR